MMIALLVIISASACFSESAINNLAAQQIAGQNAIFRSEAKAATATSYVVELAKIVITKHSSANASSLTAHQMALRIEVVDAAARGLVCLPKNHLLKGWNHLDQSGEVSSDQSGALRETSSDSVDISTDASTSGEGGSAASSSSTGSSSASAASSAGSSSSSAVFSAGGSAAAASAGGASAAAASFGSQEVSKSTIVGQGEGITALLTDVNTDITSSKGTAAGHSHKSTSKTAHSISETPQGSHSALTGHTSSDLKEGSSDDTANGDALSVDQLSQSVYQCECVPAYLCDESGYINTYGVGIIQIRFRKTSNVTAQSSFPSRVCSGHDERCCRHHEDAPRSVIAWLPDRCGEVSPASLDSRRAGGQLCRLGESPWMVAVLRKSLNLQYVCGGSLIHPRLVLTAAHCVKNFVSSGTLIARVGEWDTTYSDQVYAHQDMDVEDVKIHESYNQYTLFNDVALLKLAASVELQPHINRVCLPQSGHEHQQAQEYRTSSSNGQHNCFTTGWGKKSFGDSHYSTILKVASVGMVEHGECQQALRATKLGRWFRLHNTFTCAGGAAGVDACTGDGGSPLVCRRSDGRFEQTGIVSWGMGCGSEGVPGVYADVKRLLPWIHHNAALLSINLSDVEN